MLLLGIHLLVVMLLSVEAAPFASLMKHQHDEWPEENEIINYETDKQSHLETGVPGKAVRGSYSFIGSDGKTYTVNYIADDKGFRAYGAHLPWSNLLAETANILESEPLLTENRISPATDSKDAAEDQVFSVSNAEVGENVQLNTTQKSETVKTTTPTSEVSDDTIVLPEVRPVSDDESLTTDPPPTTVDTPAAELTNSDGARTIAPIRQLFVADVPSIKRVLTMSKLTKGPKKMTKKFMQKTPSKIIRFRLTYNPTFQSHTLTRIVD